MPLEVGAIVEGVVTGITSFGAFVTLPDGKTGLVHISEIADRYVTDINQYLKKNDRVKVKILSIEAGRIGLSIKQADPSYRPRKSPEEIRRMKASFEEKLQRFLKESDERQADLRRSTDSKRGGRGTRRDW